MRSAPGHALRPGPWCVLFVLAEPLLCGGRNRCLSRTCENKISIVRFVDLTSSWCEAVERDAFVVWHAIPDELADIALLAVLWAPLLSGTCVGYHEGVFGQERYFTCCMSAGLVSRFI